MSYVDTIFKQLLITSLLFMYPYYLSNVKIMDLDNEYIKIWKGKMRYFRTALDHTSQSVVLKYYQVRSFISYMLQRSHTFCITFPSSKDRKGLNPALWFLSEKENPLTLISNL